MFLYLIIPLMATLLSVPLAAYFHSRFVQGNAFSEPAGGRVEEFRQEATVDYYMALIWLSVWALTFLLLTVLTSISFLLIVTLLLIALVALLLPQIANLAVDTGLTLVFLAAIGLFLLKLNGTLDASFDYSFSGQLGSFLDFSWEVLILHTVAALLSLVGSKLLFQASDHVIPAS